MSMKQHFFGIIRPYRKDFLTKPKANEEQIMSEHFNYLKKLQNEKKLFLAGPTLIREDPFGVIILETDTEEEAKLLLESDPSVKMGIQKIDDFRPIRLSLIRE
ncbi:MAG: YciI family protein [Promethearchaeota archaeon]